MQFIDLRTQYQKMKNEIQSELNGILESCQFVMGPQVQECENLLATYTGSKNAITCSSGTDALVMALMALDIGVGDEVIVPAFSFFATAEAVSLVGATPIFVDVEEKTFNIDPEKVEGSITGKTKAVMYVSLYGQTPDVDRINEICKKHDLYAIEDAAQSFGASYKGKKSCAVSYIGCTSFFPAKPLGCYGDGGAVFTDDAALADVIKQIRNHGQSERYVHERIGMNGRMDTIQCAVINVKLKSFAWEVEQRERIGQQYNQALGKLEDKIQVPTVAADRTHVFGQYTLRVKNRNAFVEALKAEGVPTSIHYPQPMHLQKPYRNMGFKLPVSERLADEVVSLPMHPFLSEEDIRKVVSAVEKAYQKI